MIMRRISVLTKRKRPAAEPKTSSAKQAKVSTKVTAPAKKSPATTKTSKAARASVSAPASQCNTLSDVLKKHGFTKEPSCNCFRDFARGASGESLQEIDKMLGTACSLVQKHDTGMLEDSETEKMSLASFMRTCKDSETYNTTYFSWCDKVFYTTEFGYGHKRGSCYKGAN